MRRSASPSEEDPSHKRLLQKAEVRLVGCCAGGRGPFYAADNGWSGRKMVFGAWKDCEQEVKGASGARYKKFPTLRQAMEFLGVEYVPEPHKPPKSACDQVVYTDGACTGQHTKKSDRRAGCGVWYGHGDPRNLGVPSPFPPHTNQRAEMGAAILAMQAFSRDRKAGEGSLHIATDSTYVLKGATEWLHAWKRRGFRMADGGEVKNVDLWKLLDGEQRKISRVKFTHVKGHSGDQGNEEADALARAGAAECPAHTDTPKKE